MVAGEMGSAGGAGNGFRAMRAMGAMVLVLSLALGICASTARAEPLSMTFTEARANVGGEQLIDAALFKAPATAPFEAQIDPGSGSITGGVLTVPDFSTVIDDPPDRRVIVRFHIGPITGSFDKASGALTGTGLAGGTLTSGEESCIVSTTPAPLTLSTAGNSRGTSPRFGVPFTAGLSGAGAVAGEWTDMTATPVEPEDPANESVCAIVDEHIRGPGGIWLQQQGDVVPPSAPQLSTDPASPSSSGTPRIRGAAEAGSTVRVYAGPTCAGAPIAVASAAELGSPGISVGIAEGATAVFSATATDAVGNMSACSAPVSYSRLKAPPPPNGGADDPKPRPCIVPKLAGKTLPGAKKALKRAHCKLGKVRKAKQPKGKKRRVLVVKRWSPRRGAKPANRKVNLTLGPKPKKARR